MAIATNYLRHSIQIAQLKHDYNIHMRYSDFRYISSFAVLGVPPNRSALYIFSPPGLRKKVCTFTVDDIPNADYLHSTFKK